MGEMITKPDANPIVFALCNFFGFSAVGYLLMGQQKKAIISLVMVLVVFPALSCCFFLGVPFAIAWPWVVAYDAYLLGEKLQRGDSIGVNENGLEFLNALFKD